MTRAARAAGALLLLSLSAACRSDDEPPPPDPSAAIAAAEARAQADPRYQAAAAGFSSHWKARNLTGALQEAKEALEIAPLVEQPYVWVSRIYSDVGRNEDGVQYFSNVAAVHPKSPHAWLYRGRHEFLQQKLDEALASFAHCSELDPRSAKCLYWQGVVLHTRGDFDGALAVYRKSYALEPDNPDTAVRLVEVLRFTGDYAGAEAMAQENLRRHPDSAELHYAAAQLRMRELDYGPAERLLRQALELDPQLRRAYDDLARLLMRTGRAVEGKRMERIADRLRDYERGKRNMSMHLGNARDPAVPMLLAELELTQGNLGEAMRWFSRSNRLGGVGLRTLAGQAEALYRAGQIQQGDALMQRAGNAQSGRLELARAARAVKAREADAAERLGTALERGPNEREFLRRLADLYAELGLTKKSEELLERALDAKPMSSEPD